jgi:hypothetical protein
LLQSKKIQDHLTALSTLAAQVPQDHDHKDAKYNLIRLRCLFRYNALACPHATAPALNFDDESFASVICIILGMFLIPPSSLQVRCFVEGVVIICTCPSLYRHTPAIAPSRQHRQSSHACCDKPSSHQEENNQLRLETSAGTSSSPAPDFINKLNTFADLNTSTLKDVNLPMSDAHTSAKSHSSCSWMTSPFNHWVPLSIHSFSTLSAKFTWNSSSSSTMQAHTQWISHTQRINHPLQELHMLALP